MRAPMVMPHIHAEPVAQTVKHTYAPAYLTPESPDHPLSCTPKSHTWGRCKIETSLILHAMGSPHCCKAGYRKDRCRATPKATMNCGSFPEHVTGDLSVVCLIPLLYPPEPVPDHRFSRAPCWCEGTKSSCALLWVCPGSSC